MDGWTNLPVIAAVVVRKKVVSVFNMLFSSVTAILFISQIKSRAIVCIGCTENQGNRTEPNELDELNYSKSLN